MWKRKKFILIALLAALVLVGSTVGVALAQTGSESQGTGKTLWARVAAIVGVDQQKLESAFAQAQREMRDEALNNYLQNLVTQGKITQAQADQYQQWWKDKPDTSLSGPLGRGFGGHGFRGGMKWGGGCPSAPPTQAPSSGQ